MTKFRQLLLSSVIALALPAAAECAFAGDSPMTMNVTLNSKSYSSAVTVNQTGPGSGTNGPATAQVGLTLSCKKTNFFTAKTVGENDCIYATLRQDGPNSDGSGILVDAENTGQGFLSATEMVSTSVNTATNTVTLGLDLQEGVINRGKQMYGAAYSALYGTGLTGVLVQAENKSSWTNAFQASNNTGHTYFNVDGSGNVSFDGTARVGGAVFVRGVLQASASTVTNLTKPRILEASDCGSIVRAADQKPVVLSVSDNLPLGCHIGLVQGGAGSISIQSGKKLLVNMLDATKFVPQTAGRYAEADLFVDSNKSAILRGDLAPLGQAAALASATQEPADRLPLSLASWRH